jgi:hypothetical protein
MELEIKAVARWETLMIRNHLSSAAIAGLIFVSAGANPSPNAEAAIIVQHSGSADPTTEGWTAVIPSSGITVGAVVNDLGSGFDAWMVDDNSNAANGGYNVTPTGAQVAQASTQGWVLRTRLRVVDATALMQDVCAIYRDGATSWDMRFGRESDGDPIVQLVTTSGGPTFTLQGAGNTYNLWELRYDPVAGSADLFVNGVERLSDYTGFSIAQTFVIWGAASTADTGQGNYNLVQFEIFDQAQVVPEPTSLTLFGLGAAALVISSRRRRRRGT